MDLLDRWAKNRLEARGYIRAGYSPAPLSVLGLGMMDWPGDDDGDPELYLKYMRTSNVVFACATMRANLLAGLPLKAYKLGAESRGRVRSVREPQDRYGLPPLVRVSDAQDVTELDGGGLVDLLRRVNRWWTPRRLVHMTELSLCLSGQAFWQLDRGEKGTKPPTDIYYLKHTRLAPKKDATKIIGGWTLDPHTKGAQALAADEVVWVRFPDPADPDYGALPPLAAARLGADTYAAAMKSNWAIFANGLAPGGFVLPPEGQQWNEEQLDEAQEAWTRKLRGVEKRHRWLFMPEPYTIKENSLTPRDAEFLGGLDFSVEDVARAYGLPIELVGGSRRTYQNLENAMRAVWMFTLEPEASMLAAELTEQLVPMFGGEADFVAFDLSDVTALQEDEAKRWARVREQLAAGSLTINEWRAGEGLDPVPWGDVAWLPAGQQPIADGEPRAPTEMPLVLTADDPPMATPLDGAGTGGEGRGARLVGEPEAATPEFGSPEHVRIMRESEEKRDPHEAAIADVMRGLFERQMTSLVDRMEGRRAPALTLDDLARMFDLSRWIREFRTAIRPVLGDIMGDAGGDLFIQANAPGVFDPEAPAVVRAMMRQSQTFAREVNEATWNDLRRTLGEGIAEGREIRELTGRVRDQFTRYAADDVDGKINRAEMIARTETARAWGAGSFEAAKQSGVIRGRRWVAALDERTRPAHLAAHGQEVPLDGKFEVGGESADFPADPSLSAGNSINCRCDVIYTKMEARPDVVIDEIAWDDVMPGAGLGASPAAVRDTE